MLDPLAVLGKAQETTQDPSALLEKVSGCELGGLQEAALDPIAPSRKISQYGRGSRTLILGKAQVTLNPFALALGHF